MKTAIIWVIILAVVIWAGWAITHRTPRTTPTPTTPTADTQSTASSLPAIGTPADADKIVVDLPANSTRITSPLKVSGKARGNWFFEATAPVTVLDINGKTLGSGYIQATGDWMTTDFVPFSGTINFVLSSSTPPSGAVVFMNDNPSGQTSTAYYLAVPVYFASSTQGL